MAAILFIQNHEQREFKKPQNTWLSFNLNFRNFSQSFSTFAFSNFFSLFSLCWYINVKYSVWLRDACTFHLLEPFIKFSISLFQQFIFLLTPSYSVFVLVLYINTRMSWPFKDLKQFVIKFIARFLSYQILTGYSLKIVFYIPEVSIVFIWVQRCLLLPCHLTTDLIREWGATLAQVKHSVSETQTFNWYLIFPQSDFKQEQKMLAISHFS